MIKIYGGGRTQIVDQNTFPDGTLALNIHKVFEDSAMITWLYESDVEMFTIMCIVDILRRNGWCKYLELEMPYLINARMDRIKSSDENFSLKVFAKWLNSLKFNHVIVHNVHSNVSEALIENIQNILPEEDIKTCIQKYNPDVIFFPDEGACKRYSDMKIIKDCNLPIAFGIKKRDWKTGKIESLEVIGGEHVQGKRVLIVDDICSKGFTFFYSAQKLKELGAKDVALYITHCEDNIQNGELLTTDLISKIYTTNSICHIKHDKIEIIKEF